MCDENIKKEMKEKPNEISKDVDVQGYAYCDSNKSKCLNDCFNNTSPFLSNIN